MKKILKNKKLIPYIFTLLGLFLFIGVYMQGLGDDEPFTISLIKHNYSQIIHLDLFDVHPPLYYLLLKLFLNVTTFWTNSILIKIAFARILSFIFFCLSFYILLLVLNILKLKVNWKWLLIFFFSFPIIAKYSLSIRMYQLSSLFIALEIYGLLNFKQNKRWGLFIVIIVITLSFYTNYFTAMFGGAILFVELVSYLFKKDIKKSLYILYSGILDLILFIPGYFFLYHQLSYVSSNTYSNYVDIKPLGRNIYSQILSVFSGKSVGTLTSIVICIMIILIEIISIIIMRKYNFNVFKEICKLYIATIIGLLPSLLLSVIKHPMIIGRYGFPIFYSECFLIIASILYELKFCNKIYCFKLFMFIICLLLFLMDVKNIKDYIHYDTVNYNYICIDRRFNNSRRKSIYLNDSNAIACSTYTNNKHKVIYSRKLPIKTTLASNNKKLMLNIFNNIKYYK